MLYNSLARRECFPAAASPDPGRLIHSVLSHKNKKKQQLIQPTKTDNRDAVEEEDVVSAVTTPVKFSFKSTESNRTKI
jgi:hypothetical protein